MPDDLGLLLQPIALQLPAGLEGVAVPAERVASEGKVDTPLRLPDVTEFVQEEALTAQRLLAEVLAPHVAFGVEVQMTARSHDGMLGLKERPLFPSYLDTSEVHAVPVHGLGEGDFTRRE